METFLFNEDSEFCVLLPYLKDKKKGNVSIDKLFANQIVRNHYPAESYFLGDYSRPMLNQLAMNVLGVPKDYDYGEPADVIMGEFYELMAKPFDGQKRGWMNIQSYKGVNASGIETRLYSYVHSIIKNHLVDIVVKERKQYGMDLDFFDIITKEKEISGFDIDAWDKDDYDVVLNCDIAKGEDKEFMNLFSSENNDEDIRILKKQNIAYEAYFNLPEKDRIILQCLVVEKTHWKDAYEELRRFLNPNGPNNEWRHWTFEEKQKAMDEFWTPKQKQDAMKGIKESAIKHLAFLYNKLLKEEMV